MHNIPYLAVSAIIALATFTGCTYDKSNTTITEIADTGSATTNVPLTTDNSDGTDTDTDTGDTDTTTTTDWYSDLDGDGQGSITSHITGNKPSESSGNWISVGGDCDDSDPETFLGAAPLDNPALCLQDDDGDDYGAKSPDVSGVVNGTDCNDANAGTHPGAADTAGDGVDQNCDGADTAASASYTYYQDSDIDGYGALANWTTTASATAPTGYVTNSTDCLDTDATVHPGATEIVGNGKDDDCNTATSDTASSSSTAHTLCFKGVDANVGTVEVFVMGNSFVDATYWPAGDWSTLSTASTNQFVTVTGTTEVCGTWTSSGLSHGATFKQNGYGPYSGALRWVVQAASSPVDVVTLTKFDGVAPMSPILSGNDEVHTVP